MTGLADLAWPVRTPRLSLRPLTVDDGDALWRYRQSGEVVRWTGRAPGSREELTRDFLNDDHLASALAVEHQDEVIGDLTIGVEDASGQRDLAEQVTRRQAWLAWSIDPERQGRGFGTEAGTALVEICFESLGLHRVHAQCFALNTASWRLMERLGMRRESHQVRSSLHRELGWSDVYGYALLADEWRTWHS
ncbi:GNAT family N-acetyltransferase [Aeromicrobium piscarium]|uniref:GNAT family N-acetyltransferase n=1 Tax=Aeromicrobium piscarium TaxID=2590901 RepID=A0A554S8A2_9ACTN|nr:GNAT family N-acetyltransferase [Aeromicrobium piscarium]TSD62552.1 GNAT family N-acetyltransferase [Aeromicrobium piscarium]